MRKKLFVCLMLMACLMLQAVPVAAAGIDLSSIPEPPEGAKLVSSAIGFNKHSDGTFWFTCNEGDTLSFSYVYAKSCKVLTYVPSEDKFYTDYDTVVTSSVDGETESFENTVYDGFSDFNSAVKSANVCTSGSFFSTTLADGAYIIFVDAETSSPLFKLSAVSLRQFVLDAEAFTGASPTLTLEELNKVENDAGDLTEVKLRLNYSLPGCDKSGILVDEYATYLSVAAADVYIELQPAKASGYVDFILSDLRGMTYTVWLGTNEGNRYSVDYVVDSADTGLSGSYIGSYDVPVIEVFGIPSDGAIAPIVLTLKSNIPVLMSWNGELLSNTYSMEFDVTVGGNGVYSYSANTEVGKVAIGSVKIDCLDSSYAYNAMDLVSTDSSLVQTGYEDGHGFILFIGVFGFIVAVFGIKFYRRGRSN